MPIRKLMTTSALALVVGACGQQFTNGYTATGGWVPDNQPAYTAAPAYSTPSMPVYASSPAYPSQTEGSADSLPVPPPMPASGAVYFRTLGNVPFGPPDIFGPQATITFN